MAAIGLNMTFAMPSTAEHVLRVGQRRAGELESRDQSYTRQRRKLSKRDKTTFEQRKVSDPSGAQKR
jgi:hypothetical protein